MMLTLHMGFYEPRCGAWMMGEYEIWVDNEKEARQMQNYYESYFKETYGSTAEVIQLKCE